MDEIADYDLKNRGDIDEVMAKIKDNVHDFKNVCKNHYASTAESADNVLYVEDRHLQYRHVFIRIKQYIIFIVDDSIRCNAGLFELTPENKHACDDYLSGWQIYKVERALITWGYVKIQAEHIYIRDLMRNQQVKSARKIKKIAN